MSKITLFGEDYYFRKHYQPSRKKRSPKTARAFDKATKAQTVGVKLLNEARAKCEHAEEDLRVESWVTHDTLGNINGGESALICVCCNQTLARKE